MSNKNIDTLKARTNLLTQMVEVLERHNASCRDDYNNPDLMLDIPFMIAPVFQMAKNGQLDMLLRDIGSDYNVDYEPFRDLGYCYGTIHIYFSNRLEIYNFEFHCEPSYIGYCQCDNSDKDYRADKHCCGHDCDWNVPVVNITYTIPYLNSRFNGDASDLWKFEDFYYDNVANEVEQEIHYAEKEKAIIEDNERIKVIESLNKQAEDLQKNIKSSKIAD